MFSPHEKIECGGSNCYWLYNSCHSQTKSSNAYSLREKEPYLFEEKNDERRCTFLLFFDMKSKLNFDTEHKKCT